MKTLLAKKPKKLAWFREATKIGQAAVRDAIRKHFKAGNPVWIVKQGRVVKVSPK